MENRWRQAASTTVRSAMMGVLRLVGLCMGIQCAATAGYAAPFLVKDIATGDINYGPGAIRFLPGTRSGFFIADTPEYGEALWITDGTETGTRLVRDISPSVSWMEDGAGRVGDAFPAPDTLATYSDPGFYYEVYVYSNDYPPPPPSCEVGGIALLEVDGNLWRSDGTYSGTVPIASVNVFAMTEFQRAAFMVGRQSGRGTVLFRSDGTIEGSRPIAVLPFEPSDEEDGELVTLFPGDSILWMGRSRWDSPYDYPCRDASNDPYSIFQVWKSDGTGAGTHPVTILDTVFNPAVLDDDLFYFRWAASSERYEFWRSDGTDAGTFPLSSVGGMGGFLYITTPIVADGLLYFLATMPNETLALWRSDGTPEGTVQVYPDPASSSPPGYATGPCSALLESEIVALGSTVFFTSPDESGEQALWRSDGTLAGTHIIASPTIGTPIERPMELVAANGKVFFAAFDRYSFGLCVTDGTPEGTHSLFHTASGEMNPPSADWMEIWYLGFVPCGGGIYLRAGDGIHGHELWKSDGTLEGTRMVKDLVPAHEYGSYPRDFLEVGDRLVFRAYTQEEGTEFWGSDGTAAGTQFLRDIRSGTEGVSPSAAMPNFARAHNGLYFAEQPPFSEPSVNLWHTDGTPLGTDRLISFPIFDTSECGSQWYRLSFWPPSPVDTGPLLFAFHNYGRPSGASTCQSQDALYSAGPTSEGDVPLLKAGWVELQGNVANKSVFLHDSAYYDRQTTDGMIMSQTASLWVTNGQIEGTALLAELPPGDCQVHALCETAGLLYLDVTYRKLEERWGRLDYYEKSSLVRTDGTPQGTVVLVDDLTGLSRMSSFKCLGVTKDHAVFSHVTYSVEPITIWSTDGTREGTRSIVNDSDDICPFAEVGGRVLFTDMRFTILDDAIRTYQYSARLWATDGMSEGTLPVSEIPLPKYEYYYPLNYEPVVLGNRAVFFCEEPDGTPVLWTTDGTSAGTYPLRSLRTISENTVQEYYRIGAPWVIREKGVTLGGSRFIFPADDGVHGVELWGTDGTREGTRLLRDIQPGPLDSGIEIVNADDQRVFFSANDGVTGCELWVTDGTPLGTVRLTDLYPGPGGTAPSASIAHNGALYFSADDGSGIGDELWALPLADLPLPTQIERDILPRILNQPGAPAVDDQNADAALDIADFIRVRGER